MACESHPAFSPEGVQGRLVMVWPGVLASWFRGLLQVNKVHPITYVAEPLTEVLSGEEGGGVSE